MKLSCLSNRPKPCLPRRMRSTKPLTAFLEWKKRPHLWQKSQLMSRLQMSQRSLKVSCVQLISIQSCVATLVLCLYQHCEWVHTCAFPCGHPILAHSTLHDRCDFCDIILFRSHAADICPADRLISNMKSSHIRFPSCNDHLHILCVCFFMALLASEAWGSFHDRFLPDPWRRGLRTHQNVS